ncbi:MAG: ATP-binding protein [Cyanobacteria bacterium P01_C01_bin.89]
MLIEFSVGNYKSFKQKVTFSMVAANLVSKDKSTDEKNTFAVDEELKLLKSAAIYGANASGKSNLAKALEFAGWFMVNSSKDTQSTDAIRVEPFKLSTETEEEPSFFEIIFVLEGRKYRYGFKVTTERVISEWLYHVPSEREAPLFKRNSDSISATKVYGADGIQEKTRHNALFLSVSAQFNVHIAEKILRWMTENLNVSSGLSDEGYKTYTFNCLMQGKNKNEILNLIRKLDVGIDDVSVSQIDLTPDSFPENMPQGLKELIFKVSAGKGNMVQTKHRKFGKEGKYFSDEMFSLEVQESEGTQKIFALAAPLVDTLKTGKTLIIDEFDTRLHPLISYEIVRLFNSSITNPSNAQLIFMTHDTNLLNNRMLRRDQIWFTEKDRFGATDLYSLAEYKNVRNDRTYEKDYIKGRYGAIPYIGDLNQSISPHG